jgi:hypothetical protein
MDGDRTSFDVISLLGCWIDRRCRNSNSKSVMESGLKKAVCCVRKELWEELWALVMSEAVQ